MKLVRQILGWFLLTIGVVGLSKQPVTALVFISWGALLLPSINQWAERKNWKLNAWKRWAIVVSGLFLIGLTPAPQPSQPTAQQPSPSPTIVQSPISPSPEQKPEALMVGDKHVQNATKLAENAETSTQWDAVIAELEKANGALQDVAPDSSFHADAQQKLEVAQTQLTDAQQKQENIRQVEIAAATQKQIEETQQPAAGGPIRAPRSGSCECPYDTDKRGRSCGGRSAYSRPGGDSPACYVGE